MKSITGIYDGTALSIIGMCRYMTVYGYLDNVTHASFSAVLNSVVTDERAIARNFKGSLCYSKDTVRLSVTKLSFTKTARDSAMFTMGS